MPLRMYTLCCALAAGLAAPNAIATDASASYARALGALVNEYRAQHGLPQLALADDLAQLATGHSADMAKQHRMGHEGFEQRFQRSGRSMCVENVGWNYHTAARQFDAWKHSPVHDRNLRNPTITRMGIGNVDDYVTFIGCS